MFLNNYDNRNILLIDWLLQDLPPEPAILDVGANDGSFCPEIERVAKSAKVFAGVDPDVEKLSRNPFIQQAYPGMLEEASLPPAAFDCLVSIYVAEHVRDPMRFLQAAARTLKPGGALYFITPNGRHYFALLAGFFANLGVQDRVLRMLRPTSLVDRYHYPAVYRLNWPSRITRMAESVGFGHVEFRYSERVEELDCYFPGALKAFPRWWEAMVQYLDKETLLGNLMVKLVKTT